MIAVTTPAGVAVEIEMVVVVALVVTMLGEPAISVTSSVDVDVAVTTPLLFVPVENPAVKVPLYVPFVLLKLDAAVPEDMDANAAPTSVASMSAVAVKVRPFTVTAWPAARALNVNVAVSATPLVPSVVAMVNPDPAMLVTAPMLVEVAVMPPLLAVPVVNPAVNVPL